MFSVIAKNTQKKLHALGVPTKRNLKFAVLGGTGPTGQLLLQQALDKGHEVIALVRTPANVKVKHENLHIAKVNILKVEDILPHLADCDAIISCLGSEFKFFTEITLYTDSTRCIVEAMRRNGKLKRIILMSAWCTVDKPEHPWLAKIVRPLFHRFADDMARMETYLQTKCPDMDFTCVRCPELTNGPMESQDVLVKPDVDFSEALQPKLSRADVAKTLLSIAEENLYLKKCVAIGLPMTTPNGQ